MSTKGNVLYHPVNNSEEQTWDGFSWPAFFFGVIWLLVKGLWGHFLINLILLVATGGMAAPVIWIVYGFIGNGAHRGSLVKKGYLTERQMVERRAPEPTFTTPSSGPTDVIEKLRQLGELRERGLLTETEFAQQKDRLLQA